MHFGSWNEWRNNEKNLDFLVKRRIYIDAHGTNTNDISQEVIFFTAKFQQLLSKWELVVVISFLVLDDSWPRIT